MQMKGLPNLAALLHSGIHGSLVVPSPQLDTTSWTTVVTGKRPHRHGVLHASKPSGDGLGVVPFSRPDLQTATLGAILSAAGKTINQIAWPVTHPVEQVRGVAVSNYFASEGNPASLARAGGWPWVTPQAAAKELFARRCVPAEIEDVALAQLIPTDLQLQAHAAHLQSICRAVIAESLTHFRVAKWCMQRAPWHCTSVVFPAIKRLRTAFQQALNGPVETTIANRILGGCYEHLDMLLGQLFATAGKGSNILLIGIGDANAQQSKLVMDGPGFDKGATLPISASLLDIVPTVLTLLGVPVARDMDGQAWTELLSETTKPNQTAPEIVETWDSCIHPPQADPDYDPDENSLPIDPSVQHLVELGYIDPLETRARQDAERCQRETGRNRVLSLLDAGLLDQAVEESQRLTSKHPDWSPAYELLAEIQLQRGQFLLAEQALEFLIHRGAESARLYFALGRIRAARRQLREALQYYHVAERINSNLSGLQLAKGLALLRTHNYSAAASTLERTLDANDATETLYDALATCSLGTQNYEAAAEHALAAVEQNLSCATAHYHLALALVGMERYAEAKQALETAIAVDPTFLAAWRWLVRLCRDQLNQPLKAKDFDRRAREIIRSRRKARLSGDA